jgi:hypothetical protein
MPIITKYILIFSSLGLSWVYISNRPQMAIHQVMATIAETISILIQNSKKNCSLSAQIDLIVLD